MSQTMAEKAEQLHREGRSITPISLRQQFHAENLPSDGVWAFPDKSRGYFSEVDRISFDDWVDDIPAYNKAMTAWIDEGGRGEQPTKKRKVTKEIPAFKALPNGEAVATMDAVPEPMATPAPTVEKPKPARKLNLES
jgi:hypothetical protein